MEEWRKRPDVTLRDVKWSDEQSKFLTMVADNIMMRDSGEMHDRSKRFMHITGGPGTGKTEAIIHAAYAAAEAGARVLILCPTGL